MKTLLWLLLPLSLTGCAGALPAMVPGTAEMLLGVGAGYVGSRVLQPGQAPQAGVTSLPPGVKGVLVLPGTKATIQIQAE